MAVLQKMRNKFGVAISVIIALSLLYFIAPMDDLMNLFGRPENVGEINGTGISYEDFSAEVGTFTTINEITTGSSAQTEQAHQQIRNAAWQSLLDRFMFFKNCEAAGIKVGDAEVADLIAGNHLSPIIEQNPLFLAEDGTFSVEKVREINRQAERIGDQTSLHIAPLSGEMEKRLRKSRCSDTRFESGKNASISLMAGSS